MKKIQERPILFKAEMVRAILSGNNGKNQRIYRKPGQSVVDHIVNRLSNGISSAEDGRCWVWNRSRNFYGYGTMTYDGITVLAHRLAYEFGVGHIDDGLQVLHRCDNPSCINPSHLFLGNRSDNMKDCYKKGRSSVKPASFKKEKNPAAKLKFCDVIEIRMMLSRGVSQRKISQMYDVSQSQISNIKRGVQW